MPIVGARASVVDKELLVAGEKMLVADKEKPVLDEKLLGGYGRACGR